MDTISLVQAIGQLIGVLKSNTGSVFELNTSWFDTPVSSRGDDLTTILTNPDQTEALFKLLGETLTARKNPPSSPGKDYTWYDIPNPDTMEPSGICLIAPNGTGNGNMIGLGFARDTSKDGLSFTIYVYQTLFQVGQDPVKFLLEPDNLTYPVVGIQSNNTNGITISDGTVNTISLIGTLNPNTPTFELTFTGQGTLPGPVKTLSELNNPVVIGLLSDNLIKPNQMQELLNKLVGDSSINFGTMLTDAGLLDTNGTNKYGTEFLFNINTISKSATGSDIVTELVHAAIKGLKAINPLITIGDGKLSIIESQSVTDLYGINLQIPDIQLKASSASSQKELDLQLGSWFTKTATDTDNWAKKLDIDTSNGAGIDLTFINSTASSFSIESPTVTLTSLGLDYKGTDSKHPLFDIKGVTLQGTEARIYAQLNEDGLQDYGAAIRLDEIGIPLGPPPKTQSTANPVAGNLLSSGSGDPDNTSATSAAVNPEFSIEASYRHSTGQFNFQLYDADGNPTDTIWLPLQRTFGPIKCQKIGIGWQESSKDLLLIFDGSVELGGLTVDLIDLSIGIPVTDPSDTSNYELGLKGMSLLYQKGDLRVSGGFLESGSGASTEYNGEVIIDTAKFGLGALGSYGTINGHTSLFIFGSSTTPLGGPPAFFVDGIAAGFGYNRKFVPPSKDKVASFPLVAAAADPSAVGLSSGGSVDPSKLGTILSTFDSAIPMSLGDYWLAAGVKFKTFDLVNSNVLLSVCFGHELEIFVLGTSLVQLPPPPDNADVFASAELELEVTIIPEKGVVTATAVLAPSSFVLTPDCHLTGGFAFYTWFGDNPHAGDFVLSLGGYNPAFVKPAWYPSVKRLGFLWNISSNLSIEGDAYFALTPSCVMGGGSLTASFHLGSFLQAWYTAHADFVMTWKPFSYYVEYGVSIGVRANVPLLFVTLHIQLSVGATVQVWGPSTGGTAQVHLWFASFTLGFGPGRGSIPHTVDWASVAKMLPANGVYFTPPPAEGMFDEVAGGGSQDDGSCPGPAIVASNGLIKNDGDTWVVRAADFMFSATSHVPCTSGSIVSGTASATIDQGKIKTDTLSVRPMGITAGKSDFTVTIKEDDGEHGELSGTTWDYETVDGDLPDAIYGVPLKKGAAPKPAANRTTYTIGLINVAPASHTPTGPAAIDMKVAFTDITVVPESQIPLLPLSTTVATGDDIPSLSPNVFSDIKAIDATTTQNQRQSLVDAFGALKIYEGSGGDLTAMAADPQAVFQNAPMID